jgi:hypothetical protein
MRTKKVKELWESFVSHDKYKKYFISTEERWKEQLTQIKHYIDENKKRPQQNDDNVEIRAMGVWLTVQTSKYQKCVESMKNEELRTLWNDFTQDSRYKIFFTNDEERWRERFEQIKNYIDANKKRPSESSNDKDVQLMGQWLSGQLSRGVANKNCKNIWDNFLNDVKYKIYFMSNEEEWICQLANVKAYIDKHRKRPSGKDKNSEVKTLGKWIATQITKYPIRKEIMSSDKIRALWENLLKDKKYCDYFDSFEDKWKKQLNNVKQFMDKNKRKPLVTDPDPNVKTMAYWIGTQVKKYPIRKEIMSNDDIRKLWENFVQNAQYSHYF